VGIEHVEKGTTEQDGWIRAARPLLAVGVTLLLALGAVSLASAKGSTIHASGALRHLWLLFAFLSFAGAAAAAYQLLLRRNGADKASEAAQRLNRAVLTVFALLAVALPAAFYLARPAASPGGDVMECPGCLASPGAEHQPTPKIDVNNSQGTHTSKGVHLGALLAILGTVAGVVVLAAAIFLILRLLRQQHSRPVQGLPLPASEIVDDADLERAMLAGRGALEGEARAAIIACYAAMEDSLAAAGVARLSSDSPADLLARAAAGGVIHGAAPARLAELFREARFSTHEMGEGQLSAARDALDEILAQLTARQEAAAAATEAVAG
jgi:hypothetical protein